MSSRNVFLLSSDTLKLLAVTWKSYGPMVPFWEDLFGFILAYKEQKQESATSPSYWKVFIQSAQVQHRRKGHLRGKTGKN
jgi:hypothetical protein